MPVPTPHQSGGGNGHFVCIGIYEEILPRSASGRSAAHALDAQHERQNPKSYCSELPQNTASESYF